MVQFEALLQADDEVLRMPHRELGYFTAHVPPLSLFSFALSLLRPPHFLGYGTSLVTSAIKSFLIRVFQLRLRSSCHYRRALRDCGCATPSCDL